MNKSFESKIALVTGGNSGIGEAIAVAFARRGAKVVISARRESEGERTASMIKDLGGEAHFVRADVAKTADIEHMVDTCVSLYGGLDYAVNNAGISGPGFVPTAEYPEDDWDDVINVNLKGVFTCMKLQIPEMLKRGKGAIVNISSISGLRGGPIGVAYYASKHGVIGATKAAAFEYASQGIRVNAVCPAMTETPMTEPITTNDAISGQLKMKYPMGRFGKSEEVAETVMWLCSDEASFITGQSHPVDGGYLI
ncbi:MAG: SDR family NAD(P)-dependent oxidoreductase [Pseudomonadales bacterium]